MTLPTEDDQGDLGRARAYPGPVYLSDLPVPWLEEHDACAILASVRKTGGAVARQPEAGAGRAGQDGPPYRRRERRGRRLRRADRYPAQDLGGGAGGCGQAWLAGRRPALLRRPSDDPERLSRSRVGGARQGHEAGRALGRGHPAGAARRDAAAGAGPAGARTRTDLLAGRRGDGQLPAGQG